MLNQVVLVGRMTRDPELKDVGDKQVANFSIAVDRSFNKDETDFIDCAVWQKQAENVCKYTGKGSLVAVVGELRIDRPEKGKQYAKINCSNVRFLSKKQEEDW